MVGYASQALRLSLSILIANQPHELGYRQMSAQSLKAQHVEALTRHWLKAELAFATMKNRMGVLRWWAKKVGRRTSLREATTTAASLIASTSRMSARRRASTRTRCARFLTYVRMSLELPQASNRVCGGKSRTDGAAQARD